MATPEWIHYKTDPCYGASDPGGYQDVYNRANKQIWSNFTAYNSGTGEHDRDGDHMADLVSNFWVCEEDTYAGNAADDRDISLTDAGLDVKMIRIWNATVAYTFVRSEDMAGDNTKSTENLAFAADYIQSVGTGTFQVGTALNAAATDYYYIVYGVS